MPSPKTTPLPSPQACVCKLLRVEEELGSGTVYLGLESLNYNDSLAVECGAHGEWRKQSPPFFFLTSNPGTVVSIFIMDLPQRACDKL